MYIITKRVTKKGRYGTEFSYTMNITVPSDEDIDDDKAWDVVKEAYSSELEIDGAFMKKIEDRYKEYKDNVTEFEY